MSHLGLPELRALVYKYASELIDYPYDEDVERLPSRLREFIELLRHVERVDEAYSGLAEDAEIAANTLLSELNSLGWDLFQAEYVSTFELGVHGPRCPPYESEYVKPKNLERVLIELPASPHTSRDAVALRDLEGKLSVVSNVLLFYERYGVKPKDIIPDHVVAELEFMHYLAAKECEALDRSEVEEALKIREVQRSFLKEHLAKWMGDLARCVEVKGSLRGYAGLLRVIERFIIGDLELLEKHARKPAEL